MDLIIDSVRSIVENIHAAVIGFGPWDRMSAWIKGCVHGPRHDGKEQIATLDPNVARMEARTQQKLHGRDAKWEIKQHRLSALMTTTVIEIQNSILRLKRYEEILTSRREAYKRKNDGLEPPTETDSWDQLAFWALTVFASLAEFPLMNVALGLLPLVDWERTMLAFVVSMGTLILAHWVGTSLKDRSRTATETILAILAILALLAIITASAILRGEVMRRQQAQPPPQPEVQIISFGGRYVS